MFFFFFQTGSILPNLNYVFQTGSILPNLNYVSLHDIKKNIAA